MHINHPEQSALVDLVMKDTTEGERIEAFRNWFEFLQVLINIVDEDDRKQAREDQ